MRRTSAVNWLLFLPVVVWTLNAMTANWISVAFAVPGVVCAFLAWRGVPWAFLAVIVLCAATAVAAMYVLVAVPTDYGVENWLYPALFLAAGAALFSARGQFSRREGQKR